MKNAFDHLIVIGRPACGKSEFISFLKTQISAKNCLEKLHIAPFEELDDFVWLWEKCNEDDIWEELGHPRIVSKKAGHAYFITRPEFYDFLIEKFNPEAEKKYVSHPEFYNDHTLLIEFSRGQDHAYRNALWRFSKPVLERAAIFYIKVSFEESYRRNDARYQEKLKHSILAHKVPDEEMFKYYKTDDWNRITNSAEFGRILINGINVPFITMDNEQESKDPAVLEVRYSTALKKLFTLYKNKET